MSLPNAVAARRVLEALGEEDVDAFVGLLDSEIEIETQRGARRGIDEAAAWAGRRYDHLVRRYVVDELHEDGNRVVVLAEVQYVWRHSGKVGDRTLVGIALVFRDGRLLRWRLYDDPMEALEELG